MIGKNIDLRQLETFRMVAAMLSFSRAAVALNYAQSTVTAQIQALESQLGVPLFVRLGKTIELTDAGRRLVEYSERLLDLAEETQVVVSGDNFLSGTLTVGAPETVSAYRLPRVLKRYRELAPGMHLVFRPLPYARLLQSVRNGSVDVAFLLEQCVPRVRLTVETLIPERLVVVAVAGHPLCTLDHVRPIDLKGETLLLTERGCCYRGMFEATLADADVLPAISIEFNSVEAIKQCVMAGVGIAVLPAVAVQKELADDYLAQLAWMEPDFMVYTHMVWHPDKWISPGMQAFLDICRDVLTQQVDLTRDI